METKFEPLMQCLWELAGEIGCYAERKDDSRYSRIYAKLSESLDIAEDERLIWSTDPDSWTEEQQARVELERPSDGVPIPTESDIELVAYRMPNGSRLVTLVDGSEETWEAYCAECNARLPESKPTNPLVP